VKGEIELCALFDGGRPTRYFIFVKANYSVYMFIIKHITTIIIIIIILEKGKIETLTGMNTDKMINTLNNKEILDRMSPLKDYSNLGISTIKLLASPEAMAVDDFVGELRKMKNGNNILNVYILWRFLFFVFCINILCIV